MAKRPPKDSIWFEKPTVTERLYTAKGPSGWLETFPRKRLDAELHKFLSPMPVVDVVSLFILQRESAEKPRATSWETVIGFLGRLIGMSPFDIPPEVGLAFWGHVEIELDTRETN